MKTKWVVVGVLSSIVIILLVSGAAPLIFSEVVYGCNVHRMLALGEMEYVTNHPITKEYLEKYFLESSQTSGSRVGEWGYGTVEYSAYFQTQNHGLSDANLKITVDHCAIPTKFQFQCRDSQEIPWKSIDNQDEKLLEYLRNENCFDNT